MKESLSTYCGECQKDFETGEIVYYAWIENRSFCVKCHVKLIPKIRDWETRIISERGEDNGTSS